MAQGRGPRIGGTRAIALPVDEVLLEKLERRLGRVHARQRIGIEDDHEARVFGRRLTYFHPENWYLSPSVIRKTLKLTGLYWRARRNAERVQIRHNDIVSPRLPASFDGFTILQISDLHVDMNPGAMRRLSELLPGLAYDLCVLTGDYRGKTYGPFEATIAGMARVCEHLAGPVYGVLGNHDTIRMVPALEEMGIRMLLNESETIERGGERIHLGGIDDAHYYRVDNIEKAAPRLPERRILDPAVAHAGDLPPGGACRIRSAAERPYPWRPALPARRDPDHPRCQTAAAHRVGIVEVPRHGRVHFGRRRVEHPRRQAQLPAGNSAAPSACAAIRITSRGAYPR